MRWKEGELRLPEEWIYCMQGAAAEIIVHPWCDISIIKSKIPEPKGKIKQLMFGALLEIYSSWKQQLEARGEPYYLKLWIHEQRFSRSRVICRVGEETYRPEADLFSPDTCQTFQTTNFGALEPELAAYSWKHYLDEDEVDNDFVGEPAAYGSLQDYEEEKRWFAKLLKNPHRTTPLNPPIENSTEVYAFYRGNLWIGESR